MATFSVVVEGRALQGFAPDEVRTRLAVLIGHSEETATRLLGGYPSTVKKGVDEATALRYIEALKKIGVACRAELEHVEVDVDMQKTAPPISTPSLTTQDQARRERTVAAAATSSPALTDNNQGLGKDVQLRGTETASEGISWNLACSLLVFVLYFAWLISGIITALSMGVVGSDLLVPLLGFSFAIAAVTAVIVFAILHFVSKVSFIRTLTSRYRPGRTFIAVASVLLAISIVLGVVHPRHEAAATKAEAQRKEDAVKTDALAQKAQEDRQRAEIARTKAEGEARDAALAAKFAAERAGLIAKLKLLTTARNYQEVINIGNSYAWAKDRELDALVNAAKEETRIALASKGQWHYSTEMDKIHNTTSVWNQLYSDNGIEYGFPYDNQKLILAVRKTASDGTRVYVWMEKGQLICDISNGCPVKVKFDTSPPMTFTGWPPGDYSSNWLFLQPPERFIAQLRKSKSVVIEVQFYQHGLAQYEFTTGGFEWK